MLASIYAAGAISLASAHSPSMSVSPLAASGSCDVYVEDPHFSSGANGVISKSRITCGPGVSTFSYDFLLWVCPNPPTGSESTWSSEGCRNTADTSNTFGPNGNETYTKYVPNSGQAGSRGTGYWKSCVMYNYNNDPNTGHTIVSPHAPYIAAP